MLGSCLLNMVNIVGLTGVIDNCLVMTVAYFYYWLTELRETNNKNEMERKIKMFFIAPFLVAVIPGVIGLLLTWLFRKRKLNLYVRILPSLLMIVGAGGFFYYGIKVVRGFEGASWSLVGIFLFFFSVAGFFMMNYSQRQKINSYSMSSVILFIVSFLVYSVWFSFESLFNDPLALIVEVGFPVAGLLTAFKGKGNMKVVGILGNIFVLAFIVIIPVVSTLFWN